MEGRDFEKVGFKKPFGFSLTSGLGSILAATHNSFLAIYFCDSNPLVLEIPYNLGEV